MSGPYVETRPIRTFPTGATRDTDTGKYDYEGFLSPFVLRRYAEYMHKHREQVDGRLRASDNWQKGMPRDAYMKSLIRHVIEAWRVHRHGAPLEGGLQETLCAIVFNAMGYLHESLIQWEEAPKPLSEPCCEKIGGTDPD